MSAGADEGAHASFGASNAHRYMACPGSHRMTRGLKGGRSSRDATIGTAAHDIVARCLDSSLDPGTFKGKMWDVDQGDGSMAEVEITDELLTAIRYCVDYASKLIEVSKLHKGWHSVEQKFSLNELEPPASMFGTSDLVVAVGDYLHVTDWKFGVGVIVRAEGNPQLRYYALGALLALPPNIRQQITKIRIHVVQPRLPDGPAVTTEELSLMELIDWSSDLLDAVKKALEPEAPLIPGQKQCKFCGAAAVCPALRDVAQNAAAEAFRSSPPTAEEVYALSDVEMADILQRMGLVRMWLDRVETAATARLSQGGTIPGFKLVQKQQRRAWTSEGEAAKSLLDWPFSLDGKDIFESSLRSPAQVERLIPKTLREELALLVTKKSTGVTIAPADDKRPAVEVGAGLFPEPPASEEE